MTSSVNGLPSRLQNSFHLREFTLHAFISPVHLVPSNRPPPVRNAPVNHGQLQAYRELIIAKFPRRLFDQACILTDERFSDADKIQIIDREDMNRRSTDSRLPIECCTSLEVNFPGVLRGWKRRTSSPVAGSVPAMFGPLCLLQCRQARARFLESFALHAGAR